MDANEVVVSSKIPGRIQTLTVEEGQDVNAGQLIAVIESQDLKAALKAAEATAASERSKLNSTVDTEQQNRGETTSATVSAEAQVKAAEAELWRRLRRSMSISRPIPAAPWRWPQQGIDEHADAR